MSLFKTREWWSKSLENIENDECGHGCLEVCNIDNDISGHMKVIVGTYSGFLSIYYPKQNSYKINDLVLETKLDQPILQLKAGYFIENQPNLLLLAILHPKK